MTRPQPADPSATFRPVERRRSTAVDDTPTETIERPAVIYYPIAALCIAFGITGYMLLFAWLLGWVV